MPPWDGTTIALTSGAVEHEGRAQKEDGLPPAQLPSLRTSICERPSNGHSSLSSLSSLEMLFRLGQWSAVVVCGGAVGTDSGVEAGKQTSWTSVAGLLKSDGSYLPSTLPRGVATRILTLEIT